MKTKEKNQAKQQTERILQRLAKRQDANVFRKRALRIMAFVHNAYC